MGIRLYEIRWSKYPLDDLEYGKPWLVVHKFAPNNIYDYILEVEGQHVEFKAPINAASYEKYKLVINLFFDHNQDHMVRLQREDIEQEMIDEWMLEEYESIQVSNEDKDNWSSETDRDDIGSIYNYDCIVIRIFFAIINTPNNGLDERRLPRDPLTNFQPIF